MVSSLELVKCNYLGTVVCWRLLLPCWINYRDSNKSIHDVSSLSSLSRSSLITWLSSWFEVFVVSTTCRIEVKTPNLSIDIYIFFTQFSEQKPNLVLEQGMHLGEQRSSVGRALAYLAAVRTITGLAISNLVDGVGFSVRLPSFPPSSLV